MKIRVFIARRIKVILVDIFLKDGLLILGKFMRTPRTLQPLHMQASIEGQNKESISLLLDRRQPGKILSPFLNVGSPIIGI